MTFVSSQLSGIASFQALAWSYYSPIAAVIPSDNSVHFYNEKGTEVFHNSVNHQGRASCIAWSPLKQVLAIGWNDGSVILWENGKIIEGPLIHKAPINLLCWHPTQMLLLSASEDGHVTAWDCDDVLLVHFQGDTYQDEDDSNEVKINNDKFASNPNIQFSKKDQSSEGNPTQKERIDVFYSKAVWCPKESPFAFLATADGFLYSFEPSDQPINKFNSVSGAVHVFFALAATNSLLVISGENMFTQFSMPPTLTKHSEIKLPVGDIPFFVPICRDVVCYSIADQIFVSSIQIDQKIILRAPQSQKISSLHFSSQTSELYATTAEGLILVWKATMKGLTTRSGWTNPRQIDTGSKIGSAIWSPYSLTMIATSPNRRPILYRSTQFSAVISKLATIWQITPDSVLAISGEQNDPHSQSPINVNEIIPTRVNGSIERIRVSQPYILAVTETTSELFTMRSGSLSPFGTIKPGTSLVELGRDVIFNCKNNVLECMNLQGTVKQTISLGTNTPSKFIQLNGQYLVIISEDETVFTFDVSRRSPKLLYTTTIQIHDYPIYRIKSVSVSSGGFCISLSIEVYSNEDSSIMMWRPCSSLYLHSPQFDKTVSVPFDGRIPLVHLWDSEDSRLLCVQTTAYSRSYDLAGAMGSTGTSGGFQVVPLFVADSLEVYRQTILYISSDDLEMTNVDLPRIFTRSTVIGSRDIPTGTVLPQFEGLDSADEGSKKAMMDLNFHLATGNIDAAFNSIRGIENKNIWRSLAQMCAQTRRIDLADLCFGRMEDGGSALLLHQAKKFDTSILSKSTDEKTKQKEVKLAPEDVGALCVVDAQLGLYDQAKAVAKDHRRFDLLAQQHMSLGEWKEMMQICSSSDRIHMKMRAHQYARSLEIRGDLTEAIAKYETAGTIQHELPRLALQANDLRLFFNYVSERSPAEVHPKLLLWIGRFYEAHKMIDQALEYYDYAHATTERVRLLCCIGKWDEAGKIAKTTNQRSVMCFYARMLIKRIEYYSKSENAQPQIDVEKMKHEVVELFRKARQFAQAMDYALKAEMIDDILSLSFAAPAPLVCKAARWFEDQKEARNAILLYSRAGRMNRALALCFALKQYDALDEISDSLTTNTDPRILVRCGQYFVESERWSKAAQCYALAKKFDEVIELCNRHNIKLAKSVIQELVDMKADPEVLTRFAALCEQQGQFKIAVKLYLNLKDYIGVMKALIRSGDTAKVIDFAKKLRKKECFILAANYLQTLNPRDGTEMFGTIVEFYKKAGANDKLARFYQAAAQVEIDEYTEYEKGLELTQKGLDIIREIPDLKNKEQIVQLMATKISYIKQYLAAQSLIESQPQKAMEIALGLLKTKGVENVLRIDDLYIVMVRCEAKQGKFKEAHGILEDLRSNQTDLSWYMDVEEIKRIYEAVGDKYEPKTKGEEEDEQDDIIDDSGIEEIEDDANSD